MYRIGLIILIAFQAQIGFSQSQEDTTRDFGWMIDKDDGALVYIVQVAPAQATQMQVNRLENLSDIPPQLVGRATRISVRIGTDRLPRSPSLAEIQQMPRFGTASDVTAALGPGRVSDLESGSVVNVQGSNLPTPTLPSGSAPSSGTLPSIGQQAGQGSGSMIRPPSESPARGTTAEGTVGSLRDRFLAGSGSGETMPPISTPTLPSNTGAEGGRPQGANSNAPATRFENTAGDNPYANRDSFGNSANTGGLSGRAGSNDLGVFPDSSSRSSTSGNQGSFSDLTPPSFAGQNGGAGTPTNRPNEIRTPTPNFGSTPGSYGDPRTPYAASEDPRIRNGLAQPDFSRAGNGNASPRGGYAQEASGNEAYGWGNGYPGGNYRSPPPNYQPPYTAGPPMIPNQQTGMGSNDPSPSNRMASNSGQGNTASDVGSSQSNNREDKSASDGNTIASSGNDAGNPGNVLVQMFFLVSLVANVYLVFLIRKLLNRYRSLLTTVRSQTA